MWMNLQSFTIFQHSFYYNFNFCLPSSQPSEFTLRLIKSTLVCFSINSLAACSTAWNEYSSVSICFSPLFHLSTFDSNFHHHDLNAVKLLVIISKWAEYFFDLWLCQKGFSSLRITETFFYTFHRIYCVFVLFCFSTSFHIFLCSLSCHIRWLHGWRFLSYFHYYYVLLFLDSNSSQYPDIFYYFTDDEKAEKKCRGFFHSSSVLLLLLVSLKLCINLIKLTESKKSTGDEENCHVIVATEGLKLKAGKFSFSLKSIKLKS